MKGMSDQPRFQLFVKAGQDGQCVGDCPFSMRAYMFATIRLPAAQLEVTPVNTVDKPESFLKINPEGKVPVLIDRQENKVIPDSAEITAYFDSLFPDTGEKLSDDHVNEATNASSGVFGKFGQYMKNKDEDKEDELKKALVEELGKVNEYLKQRSCSGKFLICDKLAEIDCQLLPKLRHVQVAGGKYKQFEIPSDFTALLDYIRCGEGSDTFKTTCPPDSEIIWGWSKFFS